MITFGMRCNLPIALGARSQYTNEQLLIFEKNSTEKKDPLGPKIFDWTSIQVAHSDTNGRNVCSLAGQEPPGV